MTTPGPSERKERKERETRLAPVVRGVGVEPSASVLHRPLISSLGRICGGGNTPIPFPRSPPSFSGTPSTRGPLLPPLDVSPAEGATAATPHHAPGAVIQVHTPPPEQVAYCTKAARSGPKRYHIIVLCLKSLVPQSISGLRYLNKITILLSCRPICPY